MKFLAILLSLQISLNPLVWAKSHPSQPQSPGDDAVAIKQAILLLDQSRAFSDYLGKIKGQIPPTVYTFLLDKIKTIGDSQKLPLIKSNGDMDFNIHTSQAIIPFKVISIKKGDFLLNNKSFHYSLTDSPRETWSKISALLPQEEPNTAGWSEIVLPQAHAIIPIVIMGITVVILGTTAVAANIVQCTEITHVTDVCTQYDQKVKSPYRLYRSGGEFAKEVSSFLGTMETSRDSLLTKAAVGCDDEKKRLSSCLTELTSNSQKLFGSNFRELSPTNKNTSSGNSSKP